MDLFERLQADLEQRKILGNYRELPMASFRQDNILFDSVRYIDLSSNDYLCIARDSHFINEFFATFTDKESSGSQFAQQILNSFIGSGSTGSRLLTGNQIAYTYCEDLLASLFSRTVSCPWSPDASLHDTSHDAHDVNSHDELSLDSFAQLQNDKTYTLASSEDCEYYCGHTQAAFQSHEPIDSFSHIADALDCKVKDLPSFAEVAVTLAQNTEESKASVSTLSSVTAHADKSDSNCAGARVANSVASESNGVADSASAASNLKASKSSKASKSTKEGKENKSKDKSKSRKKSKLSSAQKVAIDQSALDKLSLEQQALVAPQDDHEFAQYDANNYHDLADSSAQAGPAVIKRTRSLDQQDMVRDCLYLSSGFDANQGVISTLFGEKDLLLVDKLAHASIIDGMLQSKAKALRFAHNDMTHLGHLLQMHAHKYENVVIITESVFSMDGDRANLPSIISFKEHYPNVLIYVDEAHSFGLLGESGLGLCQELNVLDKVDFIMGTLSKAIGSQGAFLICPRVVKQYLINHMRNFIYSTALPPLNVAFSMYIVGMLNTTVMQYRRDYLNKICNYLHLNLLEMDLTPSESQIQPLITGDNNKAAYMSEVFKRAGLLVLPIRHPTVPINQVRLRMTLNCNLRIDDVDAVCNLVKRHRSMFLGH